MSELEEKLRIARLRLTEATKALAPKHKGGEDEEYWAARDALYEAERALAKSNEEEFASPIDMPAWETGAPLPHLLQSDNRTILIYILRDHDGYRELFIEDVERAGGPPEWFGVVEFVNECLVCVKSTVDGPSIGSLDTGRHLGLLTPGRTARTADYGH